MLYRYTVPQVHLFAEKASARNLNQAMMAAVSMRVAAHGDKAAWTKLMKLFETPSRRRANETPADALLRQLKDKGLWHSLKA